MIRSYLYSFIVHIMLKSYWFSSQFFIFNTLLMYCSTSIERQNVSTTFILLDSTAYAWSKTVDTFFSLYLCRVRSLHSPQKFHLKSHPMMPVPKHKLWVHIVCKQQIFVYRSYDLTIFENFNISFPISNCIVLNIIKIRFAQYMHENENTNAFSLLTQQNKHKHYWLLSSDYWYLWELILPSFL